MAIYINNVTLNGNASVTDGVLSGFSNTSSYALVNKTFPSTNNPWEFVIPFKVTSLSSEQYIECSNDYGMGFGVTTSGKLIWFISTNGTSWNVTGGQTSSSTISINTKYYAKMGWTGSLYYLDISTDNETYTRFLSNTTSTPLRNTQFKFGISRSNASPLVNGEIYLNECYINSNGERWWNGVTTYYSLQINTTPADANVVVTQPSMKSCAYSITNHNATLSEDVLSNFYASGSSSSARYASASILHSYSIGRVNSFEIQFKVRTPSDLSGSQRVFNWNGGADSLTGPFIYINADYASLTFYNGSKYFDCVALKNPSPNTDYIFKFVLNGLTCKSYYKLVGDEEFTKSGTTNFSSANDIRFSTKDFAIGCRTYDMLNICYFKGSVDLSASYILINGVYEWGSYSEELGYEENSTVSYQVSKTGYISQSDSFNILEDTTLDIILQEQITGDSIVKLGDLSISKCYVGSTHVDKIYLGETLIFGE